MKPSFWIFPLVLTACATPPVIADGHERHCGSAPCHPDSLVDVRVETARGTLPQVWHRGQRYIEGAQGDRYEIVLTNRSNRRVEAVVSVDGLDVVDGERASFRKRGYILPPWGEVRIDGWRLNQSQVAAFRFTSVPASYAALTGDARNVGVIGVAVFHEQPPAVTILPREQEEWTWKDHRQGGASGGGDFARSGVGEAAPAPTAPGKPSDEPMADSALPKAGAREESDRSDNAAGRIYQPGRKKHRLGTEFGESRHSQVVTSRFVRANPSQPARTISLYYDDAKGLCAAGVYYAGSAKCGHREPEAPQPFIESDRRHARPPAGWRP
ncbi:MAG: hypothetical protein GMKNLPBB_02189 [Myxococcota bacterium]|nr:hypothetical protein [Myxococcota bacterium]